MAKVVIRYAQAVLTGSWFVVLFDNSPDDIFIDIYAEGEVGLLCDPSIAKASVTQLYFDDGMGLAFLGFLMKIEWSIYSVSMLREISEVLMVLV